jgi:hypothetical protein
MCPLTRRDSPHNSKIRRRWGWGKCPETMKPTDSAMNHPKPSTSPKEADSEQQMLRLTTSNTNAHSGRSVQTLNSPLSPPRWRRRRGEKRKITSFWRPGERAGEADCSSPLTQISQEILLLIHSAATVHRSNDIPMGHGREVQAL